jgi:hypothetical protein
MKVNHPAPLLRTALRTDTPGSGSQHRPAQESSA